MGRRLGALVVARAVVVLRHRLAWRHPEWWMLAISAAAWLLLAAAALRPAIGDDHAHTTVAAWSWSDAPGTAIRQSRDWLLMVAAMMFPLVVGAVQVTAARSLWRRRHRAIAVWLAGYVMPWLIAGVALSLVTSLAIGGSPMPGIVVAAAFAAAALWHGAAARGRALQRCHRTRPLAPSGWRADRDCLRYGWSTGAHCVASCGGVMVACFVAGHGALGLTCMVTATAIGAAERYMIRPDRRWLAGALAIHAVVIGALLPS